MSAGGVGVEGDTRCSGLGGCSCGGARPAAT